MQDFIKIDDSQIIEESFINFASYSCIGLRNGQDFKISRRYNDFVQLKEAFNRNWPACFIPPIPSKKHLGNLQANVIAYRQKYLNYFLKKIVTIQYLWMSKEMDIFIHGNPEKLIEVSKTTPLIDLIDRYQNTFQFEPQFQTVEIDQFAQYVGNILPMIKNFQKMAKNIMKARDTYNYEQINFVENFLPEFEKIQLNQKEQVFCSEETKQQFSDLKHSCHKNEYIKLYDFTKVAERELQSCQDALNQRQQYTIKLKEDEEKLNKLTLQLQEVHTKTLFFQNKEEKANKIKNNIENQQLIVEQLKQIVQLLNDLLTQQEIPEFYRVNKDKYIEMVKTMAQFKLKYSQQEADFWQQILTKL